MWNSGEYNTVPSFPYPACWKDEARVRVLLRPFRPRDVNPENYDSKMAFWEDMIVLLCQYNGSAVFNIADLKRVFTHSGRIPECLPDVINEMLKSKKIRYLKEFEYDPLNSWKGWAMTGLVKRPLWWGWDKFKSTFGAKVEPPDLLKYVHLGVMNELTNIVQHEVLAMKIGETMSIECVKEAVEEELHMSDECLNLCLKVLWMQGKIGLEFSKTKYGQIELVKVPSDINPDLNITEYDRAVYNLQKTRDVLNEQMLAVEKEIADLDNKLRCYIKENKRILAKNVLRKKKLAEQRYDKRSIALNNIETMLTSVHETVNNGAILEAYKIGSTALQKALSDSGLKLDNVDDVISDVREVLDTCKEIDETLSNANITDQYSSTSMETEDLEKELLEIVNENKASKVLPTKVQPNTGTTKPYDITNNNTTEAMKFLPTITVDDQTLLALLDTLEVPNETIGSKVGSNSEINAIPD